MKRRDVLQQLLWAGASAALVPLLGSCRTGPRAVVARQRSGGMRVDESFARSVLEVLEHDDSGIRAKLLEHAALEAVIRHQRLAGNQEATREDALARILESARRTRPTSRILDAWAGRDRELAEYVAGAALYLPPELQFSGTLFFVVGYDIGVAAPPDIVLNVGHDHFQTAPSEVGFYATHEAHHVGFMALRRAPALTELNDPRHLGAIIRYMTQLEGMGVHAAYLLRKERGCLGADHDYRVYADAAEAHRVTARYAELTTTLSKASRLSDEDVGAILNAMSSGERVWYQFGALACWTMEQARGRRALTESIEAPDLFDATVSDLLARV